MDRLEILLRQELRLAEACAVGRLAGDTLLIVQGHGGAGPKALDGGKYEHEPQRAHHAHGKEPAHLLHEDLEQKAEGEKAVEEVVNGRKGRSPLQAVLPMSAEASSLFPGSFCLLGFAVLFRLAALFDDVQFCPSGALLLRRTRRPRAAPLSLFRADFSLMLRFSSCRSHSQFSFSLSLWSRPADRCV